MADEVEMRDNDANWSTLLKTAYTPCDPDDGFKASLLTQLKEKQRDVRTDTAIRTILTNSYQPVAPRREFETRLLGNLKERQRNTRIIRRSTKRRTFFLSTVSSFAAAAAVAAALFLFPSFTSSSSTGPGILTAGVSLPLPEVPLEVSESGSGSDSVIPAAYEPGAYSSEYSVASAFAGEALAGSAKVLQNVSVNTGGDWESAGGARTLALKPGVRFRTSGGMGHMEFPDGTLLSLSPNSLLEATGDGLSVNRGFVLVAVPGESKQRFRLHFPERDIAVEPGTDLAVLVEDPAKFANGGAPAPMVMVVDTPESAGLALARGKGGVGPLFASQVYRLDRYVTPALPGRTLCDAEYADLQSVFKEETVRETLPMAAFAGGFAGGQDMSYTATVLSPAGFTKKGDRWVADSYRDEPTVKLKYLSDEYFGFANERRDLARELALGGRVILDGGDGVFYEVQE